MTAPHYYSAATARKVNLSSRFSFWPFSRA